MQRPKSTSRIALLAIAASLLCFASVHAKKPGTPGGEVGGSGYTVLLLDPELPENPRTINVGDINDHNSAVGSAEPYGAATIPIYWMVNGNNVTAIHLSDAGQARGINNHEQIVGIIRGDLEEVRAAYWSDPLSQPQVLPIPTGYVESTAEKINDQGFIVGRVVRLVPDVDSQGNPTVYKVGDAVAWRVIQTSNAALISQPVLLGDLVAGKGAIALDVTPAEELADNVLAVTVCGSAQIIDGYRAVTWELIGTVDEQGIPQVQVFGGPTDLGTPAGNSSGEAINVHGDVCGGGVFSFRKLFGQPVEPLLPPPGVQDPNFAWIGGMNDQAEIVGEYWYGAGLAVPVLWQSDGKAIDLNKYAKGTEFAAFWFPGAINNGGTIVGNGLRYVGKGKNSTRVNSAFMLLPE